MENLWAVGTLERGAFIQTEARQYPIAGSNNIDDLTANYLYNHELGYDADDQPMAAFVSRETLPLGTATRLCTSTGLCRTLIFPVPKTMP